MQKSTKPTASVIHMAARLEAIDRLCALCSDYERVKRNWLAALNEAETLALQQYESLVREYATNISLEANSQIGVRQTCHAQVH